MIYHILVTLLFRKRDQKKNRLSTSANQISKRASTVKGMGRRQTVGPHGTNRIDLRGRNESNSDVASMLHDFFAPCSSESGMNECGPSGYTKGTDVDHADSGPTLFHHHRHRRLSCKIILIKCLSTFPIHFVGDIRTLMLQCRQMQ